MKKKIIEWYNEEQYEIIPAYDGFGGFVDVDIKKVIFPNRKIFRTILVRCKIFNINDYESVEAGCKACFREYIEELEQYIEQQKKLDNFFKNS